jgi:hypothetical protein
MDLRTPENRLAEEMEAELIKDNFINFTVGLFNHEVAEMVFNGEPFIALPDGLDIFDVLVESRAFKSKSQAKQNWTKTDKEIEHGLCSFVVGKKKLAISILRTYTVKHLFF